MPGGSIMISIGATVGNAAAAALQQAAKPQRHDGREQDRVAERHQQKPPEPADDKDRKRVDIQV